MKPKSHRAPTLSVASMDDNEFVFPICRGKFPADAGADGRSKLDAKAWSAGKRGA